MQLPLQVTFRNIEPSEAVRADIETHAAKLHLFFDRIVSCRVAVEALTRRGQKPHGSIRMAARPAACAPTTSAS